LEENEKELADWTVLSENNSNLPVGGVLFNEGVWVDCCIYREIHPSWTIDIAKLVIGQIFTN
jgi:hypothetical protein